MVRYLVLAALTAVLIAGFGCGRQAPAESADNTAAEPRPTPPKPARRDTQPDVAPPPRPVDDPVRDLTNEDPGLDRELNKALPEIERSDEKSVESLIPNDPIGLPPVGPPAPPFVIPGDPGAPGAAAGASGLGTGSFAGRSGATKEKLLRKGGGVGASELAVARGLAWLAKQQKPNGSWAFDGRSKDEVIAATGMALLPFLGAGQTHKEGKYQKTVDQGLKFLIANLNASGKFNSRSGEGFMYAHGIATLALCEAYGMTKDKNLLLRPAQAAVNFIVTSQAPNGSWGYTPVTPGDTSIVGWQLQALYSARQGKDLIFPAKTVKDAVGFLDRVASGDRKAVYGYTTPNGKPGTALTAVGFWCRYHLDGWGPTNAGLAEGVEGLLKCGPQKAPARPDLYFYYYATQVVHKFGGDAWAEWNEGPKGPDGKRSGGMRDWLVALQDTKQATGPAYGSWEPDAGHIGTHCGRLGTTALSVLTLEVYYRHLPLYRRAAGDEPKPDPGK